MNTFIDRIVENLKSMGYTVTEDEGVLCVALKTSNGKIYAHHISDTQLVYANGIVEKIVGIINQLIIDDRPMLLNKDTNFDIHSSAIPHIERALDITLQPHQILYLLGEGNLKGGRGTGKTTAYCIKLALSEGDPIDLRQPEKYADEWFRPDHKRYSRDFFKKEFLTIRDKLDNFGFKVRDIILS